MLTIKVLPASCGDSILINFNDNGKNKNILIDGGYGSTYKNVIKNEIINIKNKKEYVDLLILTHIDDDHINGIIKFIEDETLNGLIKEVWFNSWRNFGHKPRKLTHEGKEISSKNAKNLDDKLKNMAIWNNEIIGQGYIKAFNSAKITVVSPDDTRLENLKDYIKDDFLVSEIDDRKKSINFLQKRKFIEDTAIPNGSSIAFVFEYNNGNQKKNILFLGDSFPSVVLDGLIKTGFIKNNKAMCFDYIKLSHHGSKKNMSDDLLKKIQCTNYIVSTKGCHKHPNKETFARILKYQKSINLFFNYKNEKMDTIFSNDEVNNYNISRKYLSEDKYAIEVIANDNK
jgi:beta-lactamase superfamily II metal-dependent hydrolase